MRGRRRGDRSEAAGRGSTRLVVALVLLAGLAALPATATELVLVPEGSDWKYLDDGSDQGSAWAQPGFDDTAWAQGPAELGYGDGDEATVVDYGPSASDKHITTYFRRVFSVTGAAALARADLRVKRDDGAVVYLNGVEVWRSNLPAGAIDSETRASTTISGSGEDLFHTAAVDPALLAEGENLLAVEIHQASPSSSDISFDLELVASDRAERVTRGPYLQLGTEESVVVRWRTDTATGSLVRFGESPESLNRQASSAALTTEHEVLLEDLDPATRYYYSVGDAAGPLVGGDQEHSFETAPTPGESVAAAIWVIGDSGTANSSARAVRDAFREHRQGDPVDLWLMLGDNAYLDGTDAEYQAAVFDMYPEELRSLVLWPTLGNHDGHSADSATESGPYYDIFTLPRAAEAGGRASGTEAYYSFDFGNLHFICLDSYESDRSPDGAMLTWLEEDLVLTAADWVIAFWHHPPYSKGSHDSDLEGALIEMRENVLPLLEAYGVDLVLTGHSHSYERSVLLDSHYELSTQLEGWMVLDGGDGRLDGDGPYLKSGGGPQPHEGTVYTVAGSSGLTSGGTLDHLVMVVSLNELGSLILETAGFTLDAEFVSADGEVLDTFRIAKDDCGNGLIDPGEECDALALGAATCGGAGCGGGAVACTATCELDCSACTECPNECITGGGTSSLQLQSLLIGSDETHEACQEILAGPDLEVGTGAVLTLRAGRVVELRDGVVIDEDAGLEVEIDPLLDF